MNPSVHELHVARAGATVIALVGRKRRSRERNARQQQ
jgi:hypothetical protein